MRQKAGNFWNLKPLRTLVDRMNLAKTVVGFTYGPVPNFFKPRVLQRPSHSLHEFCSSWWRQLISRIDSCLNIQGLQSFFKIPLWKCSGSSPPSYMDNRRITSIHSCSILQIQFRCFPIKHTSCTPFIKLDSFPVPFWEIEFLTILPCVSTLCFTKLSGLAPKMVTRRKSFVYSNQLNVDSIILRLTQVGSFW